MKTITGVLAALLFLASPLAAQDADSLAAEVRAETIRMRGFVRASETQATKVLALVDSLRALPPAGGVDTVLVTDTVEVQLPPDTVEVPSPPDTVLVELPPDTVVVTDTVTVELPPDTVLVELPPDTVFVSDTIYACPDGWTCTPPDDPDPEPEPGDTTAVPMPTGVSLAGYVVDMEYPREHGLHLEWNDSDAASWLVYGGADAGGENWGPLEVTESVYRHPLPADAPQGKRWACVVAQDPPRPNSTQKCNDFEWAPMMRGFLVLSIDAGEAPFAVGDSVRFELSRVDGGWGDGSVERPDSVVFVMPNLRTVERGFPYRMPGDELLYPVPAIDPLRVKWRVYKGAGSFSGSTDYPVGTDVGAIYGELSNVVRVTIPE